MKYLNFFAVLFALNLTFSAFASNCSDEHPRLARNGLEVALKLTATDVLDASAKFMRTIAFNIIPKFESGCLITQEKEILIAAKQVEIIYAQSHRAVGVFEGAPFFEYFPNKPHTGLPHSLVAHSAVVASLLQLAGFESFESAHAGSYGTVTLLSETTGSKFAPIEFLMGSGSIGSHIYQIMVTGVQVNVGQ